MTDWLEQARLFFSQTPTRGTAKTAKTPISAVMAVPHLDTSRKKETLAGGENTTPKAVPEVTKAYCEPATVDPTEGRIIAVEIDSTVLAACIWLAFDDDFDPKDGQAVFYVHELEFLKNKTPEQLRKIHALKLGAKGLGTKVRQ